MISLREEFEFRIGKKVWYRKGIPSTFPLAIQVRRTWFGTCPLNNMVKETTEKNRYRRYPVGYLGTSIRSRSADKLNRCGAIKGIKRRGYFSLSLFFDLSPIRTARSD